MEKIDVRKRMAAKAVLLSAHNLWIKLCAIALPNGKVVDL